MLTVFVMQSLFMTLLSVGLFCLQAWAFLDALSRRPDAFLAGDKMTKPAWLIILGIALAAHMLIWSPLSFLNLAGAVAAIVYLVDARPVLQSLTRR